MPYRSAMSAEEREAFLAGVHIGILAVNEPGRGPLALPIWYEYRDGAVEVGMDGDSPKAKLLLGAGRATLTVQDETPPYKYVSVEGPIRLTDSDRDVARVATRYLREELGLWYAEQNPAGPSSVVFRLSPEHWRTQDFSAAGEAAASAGHGA